LGRTVRLEQKQWDRTRETFSRWTVDPRWLIYLPPGMCSIQSKAVTGPLEHPTSAFDYYRNERINKVVVEFKHMGSRAIVIVCRDEAAAERRFGASGIGCIYTRNGRPFFEDPAELLLKIRAGLTRARFWDKFKTDWAWIDGECLPWTLKADNLIEKTHRQLLASAEAVFDELSVNRSLLPAQLMVRWRAAESGTDTGILLALEPTKSSHIRRS
jgi:protein phosphatase